MTAAAAELPPTIAKAVKKCRICHGKQLTGKKKAPAIANKAIRVIYASLTREIPRQMLPVTKSLTPDQALQIANYVSSLPPSPD